LNHKGGKMDKAFALKRTGVRALTLSSVLALSVAFPVLIHALGLSGQLFLPIFTVLMVGSFYISSRFLIPAALVIPALNTLLTGMPAVSPVPMLQFLTLEMAVVALTARVLRKKALVLRLVLPLCAGRLLSLPFIALFPALSAGWWAERFFAGWPGIVLNIALACGIVILFPPEPGTKA